MNCSRVRLRIGLSLHRYLAEFEFRYDAKDVDDGERVALEVKAAEGKRLTYREQVGRVASGGQNVE